MQSLARSEYLERPILPLIAIFLQQVFASLQNSVFLLPSITGDLAARKTKL